jgi:hypothetical protein
MTREPGVQAPATDAPAPQAPLKDAPQRQPFRWGAAEIIVLAAVAILLVSASLLTLVPSLITPVGDGFAFLLMGCVMIGFPGGVILAIMRRQALWLLICIITAMATMVWLWYALIAAFSGPHH